MLTGDIYATAAFAAGLVFVGADALGIDRNIGLVAAVAVGFAVRATGIVYKLSLPSFKEPPPGDSG